MKSISVIIIFVFIAVFANSVNSQIPEEIMPPSKYNLAHSIGAGFKEHELAFYLSFSRLVNKNFSLGIKGGIYNYNENTVDKIIDTFIAPGYSQLNPGHYSMQINNMTVRGTTYVGSLFAGYRVINFIILSASLGVKLYRESDYSFTLEFDKPTENYPAPKAEDLYLESLKPYEVKTVLKPYFSIGADYTLGHLNLGVYADNIYSAGINIGVSF